MVAWIRDKKFRAFEAQQQAKFERLLGEDQEVVSLILRGFVEGGERWRRAYFRAHLRYEKLRRLNRDQAGWCDASYVHRMYRRKRKHW